VIAFIARETEGRPGGGINRAKREPKADSYRDYFDDEEVDEHMDS
jgi:hypothetical protein